MGSRGYLFRVHYGKVVSHTHWHFGRDSKVGRDVGQLCTDTGEGSRCALLVLGRLEVGDWRWGILCDGVVVYVFGCLWLTLSGK